MSTIQSILHEQRIFSPSAAFKKNAGLLEAELAELRLRFQKNPEQFWRDFAAEKLLWQTPFQTVLDDSNAPYYQWFKEGLLNVSYNCLDKHLSTSRAQKIAVISENEAGEVKTRTYQQLHQEVCTLANVLKHYNIKQGDRVVILLPNIPEAVVAMHACNRIGAIHSVVFGGFSAESLRDRIEDAEAKMLITADGSIRAGKLVPLKAIADQALNLGCESIEHVIVLKNAHNSMTTQSRDIDWQSACEKVPTFCEPVFVPSEHPLFLLYTSGSTGKPKGIQHSSAGYLLGTILSTEWVFDLKDNDIFWCTADVGWITGHSYVAYGPLACGATIVMYEGAATIPDAGRFWRMCQQHRVSIFYTAPTAIRQLMRFGDALPKQYNLQHLRLLGSVGEPINPEAWMWYHQIIGQERCPVVDTWWQTETGSIMMAPIPGAISTKPGSCTLPLPGIETDIVDSDGNSVTSPYQGGTLVIKKPWPSMLRGIWGDQKRYEQTYWQQFNKRFYVTGDSAHRDDDGYFWLLGRMDDVLNVSGHRLGTMEIESALVAHKDVAEAAVVGKPDIIKGEAICAFVVLKNSATQTSHLSEQLRSWVAEKIGAIAKPDDIRIVENVPKTRSGKIMRRLLRDIAMGKEITQDTSTLEDISHNKK